MMTDMEILQLADQCGVLAVTKHEWDGKKFNHTDDFLDGDGAALIVFARQLIRRKWVGLTDEEIISMSLYDLECAALIGEVQRKLKDKNT